MTIAGKVVRKIKRMQNGTTFKYRQLNIGRDEYAAAAKAIERLIQDGVIERVSTGVFYKPRKSVFGNLRPNELELLKPYLFEYGKRIAYITGGSLYNRMGLTTQIPNTIKVASKMKRVTTTLGNIKVKPVKSYIDVTSGNYRLLQILDALKDFKSIPDLDRESAVTILTNLIRELGESDRMRLIKYALKYPPRARALLGAILSGSQASADLNDLKASLNPLTAYELSLSQGVLTTALDWNIH